MEKNIFIIEDERAEIDLLKMAIDLVPGKFVIKTYSDGDVALAEIKSGTAPKPDLMFLDLNLPNRDGIEIVKEITSTGDYGQFPVIILSSSNLERDIKSAHEAGASQYLHKPASVIKFRENIKSIFAKHFASQKHSS